MTLTRGWTLSRAATALVAGSVAAFSLLAPGSSAPAAARTTSAKLSQPNVVLFLTDDQRFDQLWEMPNLQSELVQHGVTFTNAFLTDTLCCPSRSSILTGEYPHHTGVYTQSWKKLDDSNTMAIWLHNAGYQTSLVGKYLNSYSSRYIPPGWDNWNAFYEPSGYYSYTLNMNGTLVPYGSASTDYSTDVLAGLADSWIRGADPSKPLMLYFAPVAPHGPATPPDRYATAFSDYVPPRPPSYNEADVSDKPAWVQALPRLTAAAQRKQDTRDVNDLRTLLAADDAVNTLITALQDTGRLSNTLFVFMSDNGIGQGEHRWTSKEDAFEESIRTPFVVRYDPTITAARTDSGHFVLNIDIAPTFADAVGTTAPGADGVSFMSLLGPNPPQTWRTDFLVEHLGTRHTPIPTYCAVRNQGYTYVDYQTGEQELYDLAADPYQLQNQAGNPAYASILSSMHDRLLQLCDPPPPGFTP
jgi:N-acetylglucosamine-6-sulfatase